VEALAGCPTFQSVGGHHDLLPHWQVAASRVMGVPWQPPGGLRWQGRGSVGQENTNDC